MYLFIYYLYISCNYWSLAFIVCDYGKCRSDWKSCVQKLKKKLFCVIGIVTWSWRADINMWWNLDIRTQEPHTCTGVTNIRESLLKPHLVLHLCLHTSFNSLSITPCVGLNSGAILKGAFYCGLVWCGQQVLLSHCVITHKSWSFHCDWLDYHLLRISWN